MQHGAAHSPDARGAQYNQTVACRRQYPAEVGWFCTGQTSVVEQHHHLKELLLHIACANSMQACRSTVPPASCHISHAGAECWAFSPPGGLCSPNLASMTASFCHSLVLGKDIVPRASAKSLNALLDALILTLGRSRLSTLRCGCQFLSEASCTCQVFHLACPESSGPSNAD